MADYFGACRMAAVEAWRNCSHRTVCGIKECYDGAYECQWQTKAMDEHGFNHVSLFCSLADWSCNITDLLTDERFDDLDFESEEDCYSLARFYTRFLLVVAEVFSDLSDIVKKVRPDFDEKKARQFLSSPDVAGSVDGVQQFVNTVCKHKVNRIHLCNHHLPFCFLDMAAPCQFDRPLTIGTMDLMTCDAIQYPSLLTVIEVIGFAYQTIDQSFNEDIESFTRLCRAYDQPETVEDPEEKC